ncbi:hypothetical protein AFL94_08440 [Arthrobacter sp. LS16]|nr:hypothetical protein AFL94_08440 [Arthrobacter sp. LS16]
MPGGRSWHAGGCEDRAGRSAAHRAGRENRPAAALLDRELVRHLGLVALGLVAVGAFLWEIGYQARGPALAFPFALLQAAPSSSPIR